MCSLLGATALVPSTTGPDEEQPLNTSGASGTRDGGSIFGESDNPGASDSSSDSNASNRSGTPEASGTDSTSQGSGASSSSQTAEGGQAGGGGSGSGSESGAESGSGSGSGAGPEIRPYSGESEYQILLSEPLTPGQPVTITVLKNEQPVEDVVVTVNGDRVGQTDQFGDISATVPFTEQLNVSAQRAAARQSVQRQVEAGAVARGTAAPRLLYDRGGVVPQQQNDAVPPVRRNESLGTDIRLIPLREPRPGQSVTFVARIDGAPVSEADVRRNGTVVGQTDANGRIEVALPWTRETTVSVRRGAANGTWTHSFAPLRLTVQTGGKLPLAAGLPASVAVTQDGRPVDRASIRIGSESVGQTQTAGVAGLRLPHANHVTVTATRGGLTATTQLSWLYLPYLLPLAVVVAAGAGITLWRRYTRSGRSITSLARRLARTLLYATIRGARRLPVLLEQSQRRLAAFVTALRGHDLRAALQALAPATNPVTLGRRVAVRTGRRIVALFERVRALVLAQRGVIGNDGTAGVTDTAPGTTTGDAGPSPRLTVREAFERVRQTAPGETRTMTPDQIGVRASAQGLPDDAVGTIVDAFRDVTYGTHDPAAKLDLTTRAVERLGDEAMAGREDEAVDAGELPQSQPQSESTEENS